MRMLGFQESESIYRSFNERQYRPLAQHSRAWQAVLDAYGGWNWRCLGLCEGKDLMACLPFCERETDIGKALMSSPLPASYGGVLHINECDVEEVYRKLLTELQTYAKDKRFDIISILTSPFRDDISFYEKHFSPDYTLTKFYQYLPGAGAPDEFSNSKFRNNLKRNLRKAKENGFRIERYCEPPKGMIETWYETILSKRMNDIGAPSIPLRLFKKIAEQLGPEKLCEFAFVMKDDEMVAGGLFTYGYCQDIFMRAAKTEALKTGAAMFLDYHMLKRGHDLKAKAHNFQSSPSRESPGYAYKKNWGCLEGDTHYLVKAIGSEEKFIKAGKDAVIKAFPHFFILPFSVYGSSS